MACFEGKCFERPKNEIKRSGALSKKGSRVKVVPAGDLVMGVHPNAERPSEMENMNALNEGAIDKRGYNSAQRDCGCAKDYNLPEPFVEKFFPKPAPPPVFTPEPPPKYEPKAPPPEEFVPIPEPELKDNIPLPPPEPLLPIPPNVKKQNPGPPPPPEEPECTGYEWLPRDQAQICCDELETVYGGNYDNQQKMSETCRNPTPPTTEVIETPSNPLPPLSQVGPNTRQNVPNNGPSGTTIYNTEQTGGNTPPNVIKVNTKGNNTVKIVENNVGEGFTTSVVPNALPNSGFTVGTLQNGNVQPQPTVPNNGGNGGFASPEDDDIAYEQDLVDTGTDFSMDIPAQTSGNDSISHFTGVYTQPSFPPVTEQEVIQPLSQQDEAPEEAQIIGQSNTASNKPIVAPSSGMNFGLDEIHGLPQCNSIVRSVTVSRCGDENPYSRGLNIYDPYAGRHADPPGFVVDKEGRKVLKVKSSSGMRTRIMSSGIPGAPNATPSTSTNSGGPAPGEQPKTANDNQNQSRSPSAGAVTASVFNSLGNVFSDAIQYMNNQDSNRIRLQISNLQQQRDLQLAAINSGDARARADAEARLAQINQQGQQMQQTIEQERLRLQAGQQAQDRDMSFRTTALIAGSVLVLGMMGAGIYVATKK